MLSRSGEGDGAARAREKWAQAVRRGVVALAYDLAWLAWRQGHSFAGSLAEIEDLGGLVMKATALADNGRQAGGTPPSTPPGDHGDHAVGPANPGGPPAPAGESPQDGFPFDFDALAREFVAGLEGFGGGSAESVVLVAKPGVGVVGEGEDEEWDLVEAGV